MQYTGKLLVNLVLRKTHNHLHSLDYLYLNTVFVNHGKNASNVKLQIFQLCTMFECK